MNTITYSDQFLEDLGIRENTLMITGYEFLYQENPDILRGKTEGLEVLYEDSSKNLQILIDLLGFNIYNFDQPGDDEPGYLDIMTNTGETEYWRMYFYYCVYPGGEEKLAFTLSESDDVINDLCVTRNIFEITLPSQAKASIIGINSDTLKFLEGPGKEVGSNLWIDGEDPDSESMVSRDGYYRYTRIENTKYQGSLGWSPEGSRVYQGITTRKYENLQIDFGNFTQDSRSNIWVRNDLSMEGGVIYLHGTVDYIDYSESFEEIGRGTLPIESVPELEILGIGHTGKFSYTIDNFLKAITYGEVVSYNLQYGIFQVHIPSFISAQEEIYSPKFKLIIKLPETEWTFDPQTEDSEDDGIPVIVLDGEKDSTREVLFTTNIPIEYLDDNTCKVEVDSILLDEYFEYLISYSEKDSLTECVLTIVALNDNNEKSWVPQDESGNPYLITFTCSIDDYSQSMYVAQYPKTPDLVVLDSENNETSNLIISEDENYSQFTIGVKENEDFKIWNATLTPKSSLIPTGGFYIRTISGGTSITSGDVYLLPTEGDPNPESNYKYAIVGNIRSELPRDELLGEIKFVSSPDIDVENEEEENIPAWRTKAGSSSVIVKVTKKSKAATFYWGGEDGTFTISSISLDRDSYYYYLPIYTNRRVKVTLTENRSVSLYSYEGEEEVIEADSSEGFSIVLYNKEVKSDLWGDIIITRSYAGKLTFESLATDLPEGTPKKIEISIYRAPMDSPGYHYGNYNNLYPVFYAVEYTGSYSWSPDLNRFGTIDNCFENSLVTSLFTKFYYTSSTNSEITSIVEIAEGFYGGNTKTCKYYYQESYTNQEAQVEIAFNKDYIDVDNFYFPTVPIAYAVVKNWKPYPEAQGVVKDEIVVGGIFMKPFSNKFWYRIKYNDDPWGELSDNTSEAPTLMFEKIAGETTIQIEIYSRYVISQTTLTDSDVFYITDGLTEGTQNIPYNGDLQRSIRVVVEKNKSPNLSVNFCRYMTTYTLTAVNNNTQETDPFIRFGDIVLDAKEYGGNDVSKYVHEDSLNNIYDNEINHHGERYNVNIARHQWDDTLHSGGLMSSDSSWGSFRFKLIQKGNTIGNIEITPSPSFSLILPSGGDNYSLDIVTSDGIIVDTVENESTGIEITPHLESNTINCTILGVLQEEFNSDPNSLWSDYYTFESPGVFYYASPNFTKAISTRITLTYHSEYGGDSETYIYDGQWTQPGYTNAVYFSSTIQSEKFGVGIYKEKNLDPGILNVGTEIDGNGQEVEALLGIIGINNNGVTSQSLNSLDIVSFDGSNYNYDSSPGYERSGGRTNLTLVFPPNNTGGEKTYSLVVEKSPNHRLKIKFTQGVFTPTLEFVKSNGVDSVSGGLHILSDGTIQGGYGIGNTDGDLGCLYIKTNLQEAALSELVFSMPGSSIEEDSSSRQITRLTNSGGEAYYKVELKFYPNRSRYNKDTSSMDGYATGDLYINYGGLQLNSTPIETTQYCFAIELQYYGQNSTAYTFPIVPNTNNHVQPYVIYNLIVPGESIIPYTISNKDGNRSCFSISRIYCSDPDNQVDYNTKEALNEYLSTNVSITSFDISDSNIFTEFRMELLIEDSSHGMGDAVPYIWATYGSDNFEEQEINNIGIDFTIKAYYTGEGYKYLEYDTKGSYQLFGFKYFCKKLITQ